MKKEWQAPSLEVLDIGQTMLGVGSTYIDWTYKDGKLDLDFNDEKEGETPIS